MKELDILLRTNMKNEEEIQKLLSRCSRNAKLRDFYKDALTPSFYRNKLMLDAIKNEETLIGIVSRYAKYMAVSNCSGDMTQANWALWFIHFATNMEIRDYYRSLFNNFHKFVKQKYPNAVGNISGRIKNFVSYWAKILEVQNTDEIKDLFAFRFVLRANNHESPQELITTLFKICADFIEFCAETEGISVIQAKIPKNTQDFDHSKHPEVILPSEEALKILKPYSVKNYAATPKEDGYQSVHVILQTVYGPFEVQFRTQLMHEYAEFGPASHNEYKDKPFYNFFKKLAKAGNPNEDYTNFLGLTASDFIFDRKLRHPDDLQRNTPRTASLLDCTGISIDSILES